MSCTHEGAFDDDDRIKEQNLAIGMKLWKWHLCGGG
jgi:hypothetical protein